jgi:hypothetical protein
MVQSEKILPSNPSNHTAGGRISSKVEKVGWGNLPNNLFPSFFLLLRSSSLPPRPTAILPPQTDK